MAQLKYWDGTSWVTAVVGAQGDVGATGPQPPLSAATPQALGTAAAGAGTSASKDDHVHPTTGVVLTAGGSTITVASGTTVPLTIQNNGTGNSFVVNDVASDTTPFVIDAAGNVGVGAASPSSQLTVGANPPTAGAIAAVGATGGISLALSDNVNNSLYVRHVGGGAGAILGTDAGGSLRFATGGNTATEERMRITDAGNVGIGTASPTTKLDILSDSASLTGLSVSPHSSGLTATITNAVQSGGTVTYTATNTFTAGQQVTITGITPTTYNVNNVTIKTATGSNFTIATATLGGTYVSGGTATAYANLQEWQTNAGVQVSAISQNGAFSSSSTETIIENSGDTFGTTRLRLQNRSGQGGPLFEQAGTVDVVDFGFKIPSSQSLIRYDGRYGNNLGNDNVATNGPEFQFGNASTTTQGATVGTWFPLVVGAGLLNKRVQINSTTGNNTALTIKAIPTKTATITGATVTTFTNKSGTIVIPQAVSATFSRITGIASTTGLLAGMTLTYVSGVGTFGGGTATIISVDSSTAITIYSTAVVVAGATVFSIQNSVTYTATNTFSQTHGVTITGATAAGLNVSGATIGAVTGSTFTIINTTASGTWSSGGTATITQTSNLLDIVGSAGTILTSIKSDGTLLLPGFQTGSLSFNGITWNGYSNPAGATTLPTVVIKGIASQTGNLTEWQNSAGTVLASVSSAGAMSTTTAAVDTNTTQVATTAYVVGQGYLKSATAASTYSPIAGSSSITTTGTVASGTWSGSFGAVSGANLTSLTAANISSGTLGSGVVPTAGTTTSGASGLGYMGMPQNINPGSVSILATDAGKHLYYTTTGQTLTIPAATALALPIGFTFTVINAAAVTTTIAITTDTMYLAGTGTTGSRTLAAYGMATAVKVSGVSSAGVWMISGNGLT